MWQQRSWAGSAESRLARMHAASTATIRDLRADGAPGYGSPGLFVVAGAGMSSATGEIVQAVIGEIRKLRTVEVSDEDLRTGKEAVAMRLATGLDNKFRALTRAVVYEYYGYPPDMLQQYEKNVAGVTRGDVLRVAKDRLDPEKLTVAAVSNVAVFSKPLDPRGGATQPIDLTIAPMKAEPAGSDPASVESGKRMLQRAQQASGGAEKLAAIQDLAFSAVYNMAAGGTDRETDQWIAPSNLREDAVSSRIGTLSRYTDGTSGWMSNGRASAPLIGDVLQQTNGDLFRLQIPLLLSDRAPGRLVKALDDDTIEITLGGQVVRVVFDPATGLPAKLSYELSPEKNLPVLYQEDLSDYRDVNGIRLPFATTIYQGGVKFAEGVFSGYKVNQGLKLEVLQRRP